MVWGVAANRGYRGTYGDGTRHNGLRKVRTAWGYASDPRVYNGRRFSRNMVMNGVGNARIAVPPPQAIVWGFGCRMGFPSAESGDFGEEYPIVG